MHTVPELQAALDAARASQAHYRLLALHSDEASWIIDCASQQLLYLSPAAERQFGYTLEMPETQALASVLVRDLPARLKRYAAGDHSRLRVRREAEQPHRDGRLVPVEISSTLVLDPAGQPSQLVGVVRDLSERRAFIYQQKQFASMLSHEFRTPLSTIDGAVQRLEMTGAHHDEATRKRYAKIQRAVDRLLAMLDDYLSPERMASIGRVRQPNEVAPASLLEAVAAQGRTRGRQVVVRTAGLPAWMRCDPAGMRLCLEILLDNAIKYTNPDTAIELIGRIASEGGVELLVRDHGPGIPETELAQVFERGYRGSSVGEVAGSGLGLYMARSVIDVHGGTVSARNGADSGAEFRIWLPIAAGAGKGLAPSGGNSDNCRGAS